jgi:hypothetical protein
LTQINFLLGLQSRYNIFSFKDVYDPKGRPLKKDFWMKTMRRHIVIVSACLLILITGSSCNFFRNLFGPKYGCPSNGKNVGAERILSGEKVPKAKKFKA